MAVRIPWGRSRPCDHPEEPVKSIAGSFERRLQRKKAQMPLSVSRSKPMRYLFLLVHEGYAQTQRRSKDPMEKCSAARSNALGQDGDSMRSRCGFARSMSSSLRSATIRLAFPNATDRQRLDRRRWHGTTCRDSPIEAGQQTNDRLVTNHFVTVSVFASRIRAILLPGNMIAGTDSRLHLRSNEPFVTAAAFRSCI